MTTKRVIIGNLIRNLEEWAVESKLITSTELEAAKVHNNVTVDKIVAYIEHFALEPHNKGDLRAYIESEYKHGRFLLLKLATVETGSNKENILRVANTQIKTNHIDQIDKRLTAIINVMLL